MHIYPCITAKINCEIYRNLEKTCNMINKMIEEGSMDGCYNITVCADDTFIKDIGGCFHRIVELYNASGYTTRFMNVDTLIIDWSSKPAL